MAVPSKYTQWGQQQPMSPYRPGFGPPGGYQFGQSQGFGIQQPQPQPQPPQGLVPYETGMAAQRPYTPPAPVNPNNQFGGMFTGLNGQQTLQPKDAFRTQFQGMQGPVQSGRKYMDPSRAGDRDDRRNDRFARRSMANFELGGGGGGGGGGHRGGGGGGGGGSGPQMQGSSELEQRGQQLRAAQQQMRPFIQPVRHRGKLGSPIPDAIEIAYGTNPSLGYDYAKSATRIKYGQADISDFETVQRAKEKTQTPTYNAAVARSNYRQYMSMQNPNSLGGNSIQYLYS